MSVVLLGSTSGSVTLQEPAVAGSTVIDLPATSGTMAVLPTATSVLPEASGGTGTTTGYYGFKNRLINSAMVIDQRNAGASVTNVSAPANFAYSVDRWGYWATQASKFTLQQSSTAPAGFTTSLKITSSSAYTVLSTDYFTIGQNIEGFNVADLGYGAAGAATVTISFWVQSSLTGTFGGALSNGSTNRSYAFTYTISAANTWEQKTITVAGDTTGTWNKTNSTGLILTLGLGVGSTATGATGSWAGSWYASANSSVNVVSTNGATFYITGVQLEKGSTATSFDYRPYSAELAMCQRYYWQLDETTGGQYTWGTGANGASDSIFVVQNPVYMRSAPTAGLTGSVTVYSNATNATKTSYNSTTTGTRSSRLLFSVVGSAGASCWSDFVSGAKLTFSSEL
jgi:hypothetical protein